MLLTTTSSKIRVSITGGAGGVCHASYVDYQSGVNFQPGSQNTTLTNAVTTDVVLAPGVSQSRSVKRLFIRNTSASLTIVATIIHTDGVLAVDVHQATLTPGSSINYTDDNGFFTQTRLLSTNPSWANKIIGTVLLDPSEQLFQMQNSGNIAATPTNITISIARCSLFIPTADITVQTLRWYGVDATTNVHRVAIYRLSDLARLTAETPIVTVANSFNAVALAISLTAGVPYFLATSVNAIGTTPGVGCIGTTIAATTGQIQVAPLSMPGFLYPGNALDKYQFQFAVTTGALPATAPTLAAQAAWTGGMPAFWLDNSTAAVGVPA